MKRLQISLEEDLDEALAIEASRKRTSKAALIREYVRERLGPHESAHDPMSKLIGHIDEDPGDIDEVVYRT